MFEKLSDRLGGVFDRLRGRGALNEQDVREAMREVRVALLEADVALPVVRDCIEAITEKAVGQSVLKSVTPVAGAAFLVIDDDWLPVGQPQQAIGLPMDGMIEQARELAAMALPEDKDAAEKLVQDMMILRNHEAH